MSWLARSLANLRIPGEGIESEKDRREERRSDGEAAAEEASVAGSGDDGPRGVKEDLSEITKTLTRQLWGVASFIAPPPFSSSSSQQQNSPPSSSSAAARDTSPPSDGVVDRPNPSDTAVSRDSDYTEVVGSPRLAGIRGDLAEIGGRFRTEISKLSGNIAVSEISKIASSFLPFVSDGDEDEDESVGEYGSGGAIGITEEVLAFARNISMHPETWLDFPLFFDDEDSEDFDMSDAQHEHALAVEHVAPRLAALRIELCPSHMSEGCFWKIYFVLLHSRLSKHDAELLSTPQIVEARALWLQELQNRTKPAPDRLGSGASFGKEDSSVSSGGHVTTSSVEITTSEEPTSATDFETEKHPVVTTEIKIIDKSVVEEQLPMQTKDITSDASANISVQRCEDDGDDWLEETTEMVDSRIITIPIENDEDVSFSDLEEDDDDKAPTSSRTATDTLNSQAKEPRGWVQLSKSSGDSTKDNPEAKESNEWSDLEDIDVV